MLAWRDAHRRRYRHLDAEHTLDVVRGAGRVTVSPAREDRVAVRDVPGAHAAVCMGIDAGLLAKLARGGDREVLAGLGAAGHRLPVAREIGALEHQHAKLGSMNDDQRRKGLLEGRQLTNTQNGWRRSRQNSAASSRIS